MPIPLAIARANRRLLNPVIRRFAGRIPPFAIIVHRGRKSGREFRTPIMAFPAGGQLVIALTYGPDIDWLKNVQARGDCVLIYRGRELTLSNPRLVGKDEGLPRLPAVIRPAVRLIGVREFLVLDQAERRQEGSDG